MSNLIPMDEAARILGMTVEQVTELRSNNEIFGYKDGANWKFKMSELERVADEMGIELKKSEASDVAGDLSESFGFDLSESSGLLMDDSEAGLIEDLDSAEYIEDSSVELAQPGSDDESIDLDESELKLADSGLLDKKASDTAKGAGSDVSNESVLDDEEELSFGSSSLRLASDSAKLTGDSAKASDSSLLLGGDDDLSLSEDDFTFGDDSGSFEESAEMSSDFEDSEDSGNLILDDSSSSNEITLEPNESGINLAGSSSSKLDEESSLDLGVSDIDALDLPDDSEEIVVLDELGDAPVMLEEDDFNLTPLENSMDDDDSSGSQVIALEDSEIYADDSAATVLGDDSFGDASGGFGDDASFGGFQDPGAGQVMAPGAMAMAPEQLEEAPYSLAQILSLGGILFLMLTGSMVAYNLAQNLWIPSEPVGSSVLTFFLKLVGAG